MGSVFVLLDKRFNGYRVIRLPDERDDVVTSVVEGYCQADAATRQRMLDDLAPRAAGVLSVYGERMAAIAVRTGSTLPLQRGLIGMGMANDRLEDHRNNLIVLAAVNHRATLLGTTLDEQVTAVARFLPASAEAGFRAFAGRAERDKSLSAMALATYGSGPDFRYVNGPTG